MRLQVLDAERIESAARRRTRASLWVGVAFVSVGLLTATAAATLIQWLTAGLSLLLGGGLVAAGWPARRRIVIDRPRRVLRTGQSEIPIDAAARLELTGTRKPDDDAGTRLYQASLKLGSQAPIVVLEHKEPDRVLEEARRIAAALSLALESGWGLPAGALQARPESESIPVVPAGLRVRVPAVVGRRQLATLLFVSTAFVAIVMTAEVLHRIELGDTPTVLALTLPVATVLSLLAVAAAVATYEARLVTTADHATREVRVIGLVVDRRSVDRASVTRMAAVSPDRRPPLHLLFLGQHPLALPAPEHAKRQIEASGRGRGNVSGNPASPIS